VRLIPKQGNDFDRTEESPDLHGNVAETKLRASHAFTFG
jgi:hypothetical protein